MKALATTLAVALVAAGLYFALSSGDGAERSTEIAPADETTTTAAAEPAAELAPVELVQVFDGTEAEEEFSPSNPEGLDLEGIDRSHILKQEVFPDGSAYVEVASPLRYQDGRKKTVIRRMHARPSTMPSDKIQVRKFSERDAKAGRRDAGGYLRDRREKAEKADKDDDQQ